MSLVSPRDYLPYARKFEGSIPHLYLDTVGIVTVGIGHAMPKVGDALALFADSGAGKAEISRQYNAVKSQPKNRVSAFYERLTTLRLGAAQIDRLFESDCADFIRQLDARIAGYRTMPPQAQLALLDMAFNLGVSGLTKRWPRLMAAVAARDWLVCAAECERPQLSIERNIWTRDLFYDAHNDKYRTFSPARDADNPPAQPAPPGPRAPESPKPLGPWAWLKSKRLWIGTILIGGGGNSDRAIEGFFDNFYDWFADKPALFEAIWNNAYILDFLKGRGGLIVCAVGIAALVWTFYHDRGRGY